MTLVVFLALITTAVVVRSHGTSRVDSASHAAFFARLTVRTLPVSGHFGSLTRAGGRLIAAGGPGGYPLNVSGATTTLVHGRATGRCAAAVVIPRTLRVARVRHGNCGDPALYRLRAMPIMFWERAHANGPDIIGVRVAIADPAAADGYRLGPILARFEQCSDCAAQWIAGDHALWINVPLPLHGGHSGEILRVSITTGRVLQRYVVPQLLRALLAVNRTGLWVAPSVETGEPGRHPSRREQREYSSLIHIAPGVRRARETVQVGRDGVPWLAAAGDRVWFERQGHRLGRACTFSGPTPALWTAVHGSGPATTGPMSWATDLSNMPPARPMVCTASLHRPTCVRRSSPMTPQR